MGYGWFPVVRLTPSSGPPTEIVLRDAMAWSFGPTRTRGPRYTLVQDEDEDPNFNISVDRRGVRTEVGFEFQIGDNMSDHNVIADIVNCWLSGDVMIELSMDSGTTWREVIVSSYTGPESINGKPFVGAKYEIVFKTLALQTEIVPIGSVLSGPSGSEQPSGW